MERNWSDGERRGVPIAIRFEGIVPLDDVVYYIRSCGQRVAEELQEPGRCEVHASRVTKWPGGGGGRGPKGLGLDRRGPHRNKGERRFEVRIDLADRHFGVQARSADDDLYVAIWRGFDAILRELARARARVEPLSRSAPATATRDRDTAAGSGE